MRIWAVTNQKGGSGKSTLATQIAAFAEQQGQTCCLIDLDQQTSAARWSAQRETKPKQSKQPLVIAAIPEKLNELISAAATFECKLVIIDTASKIDASALAAMRVSSLIICPTLASLFDLQALADTVRLLELADKKARAVVVVNRVPESKAEATIEQAAAAVGDSGVKVAPVYVCDRPQFAAAIQKGKGVTESHSKTKAADEIRELWAYLDKLEGKLAKGIKEAAE